MSEAGCPTDILWSAYHRSLWDIVIKQLMQKSRQHCEAPSLDRLCLFSQRADGSPCQRKTKGGGKLREGKTYHKTPSQKRFWTPLPMIRFPPPVCFRPVVLLRGNRHRPGKSHFLRPPNFGGRTLWHVFPQKNRTIRFAAPLAAFQPCLGNTCSKQNCNSMFLLIS